MTAVTSSPNTTRTLGAELERRRLEVRIGRVEQAIAALRDRRRAYGEEHVPKPLVAALRDFGIEAEEMRERLQRIDEGDAH